MKIKLLYLVFFCLILTPLLAQKTNRGKDFYFTFPPNLHDKPTYDGIYVFISSKVPTSGTITCRNYSGIVNTIPFNISNPAVVFSNKFLFSDYELTSAQNCSVSLQYFRVTSNDDVTVYALNQADKTADAALIFPNNVLANEYTIMSYKSHSGGNPQTPSQFAIVATENNTKVDIQTTTPVTKNNINNISNIILNKGDSYLVQANINPNYPDLTGSQIVSTKPIAVFGSQQRALIPVFGFTSRDYLYEEIPPNNVLGKRYLLTPFASQDPANPDQYNIYRILAIKNNTNVFIDQNKISLNQNQFYENALITPERIISDKPIMVAIFKSSSNSSPFVVPYGDPLMIVIPPEKQFLSDYTFISAQSNDGTGNAYTKQYATIICPTASIPSLVLDGNTISNVKFNPISNSCYSFGHISNLKDGSHTIKGDKPFGIYVYGFGQVISYGYLGGMSFDTLSDNVPIALKDTTICLGQTVELKASGGVSFNWQPVNLVSCSNCQNILVKPNQTTIYTLTATDDLGCQYTSTVKVTVSNNFKLSFSGKKDICIGDSLQLSVSGASNYTWLDSNLVSCIHCSNPYIYPKKSGFFRVIGSNIGGCDALDSIFINVNQAKIIDKAQNQEICYGDSVLLYVQGGIQNNWSPNLDINCMDCDTVIVYPKTSRFYKFDITDINGCKASDSIFVKVNQSPNLSKSNNSDICLGDTIQLVVSGGKIYNWKPNTDISCLTCDTVKVFPKSNTMYYIEMTDSNKCKAFDSIMVSVHKLPITTISKDTNICLGYTATVTAFGGKTYKWFPNIGIECDTCPSTKIIPDTSRRYYVKISNDFGCTVVDSIFINTYVCGYGSTLSSHDFPSLIKCDSIKANVSFVNTGIRAISLDSLYIDGSDKLSFQIFNYSNLKLPKNLEPNQFIQIPILYRPLKTGDIEASVNSVTNVDTVHPSSIIRGNSYKRSVKLKIFPDTLMTPGDSMTISISLDNFDNKDTKINQFEFKFIFKTNQLKYLNNIQFNNSTELDPSSNISLIPNFNNSESALNIYYKLINQKYLDSSQKLFDLNFVVLLSDTLQYKTNGILNLFNLSDCIDYEISPSKIDLDLCLEDLRFVKFSNNKYDFQIIDNSPNDGILNVKFSIGILGSTNFEIFNSIGQSIYQNNGILDIGNYSKDINIRHIANGMYFIKFTSGPFTCLKSFIIYE